MRRATLLIVSIFVSLSGEASEGLVQASMAYCMDLRERVTQDVAACVTEFPALSTRANTSLASWLKRNDADFQRVSKQCEAQFRKDLPDQAKFDRRVQELRQIFTDSRKRSLKQSGVPGCEKDLSFLEDQANDLSRTYPVSGKP